jgi:hypothetical protein
MNKNNIYIIQMNNINKELKLLNLKNLQIKKNNKNK